ncbi:hypothetical protein IWW34DRAFT_239891 [Fusarium oxysporum f. sp. albedinis]|nr:hypothetical protein IWW34DRAFT_239891 [Fusarium oxysporum f. sp. albedinis]
MEEKRHQGLRQQYFEALHRQRLEEGSLQEGLGLEGLRRRSPRQRRPLPKTRLYQGNLRDFWTGRWRCSSRWHALVGWPPVVFCRRRETLLAIFEQDEGCKRSENGFAGIGTSPSPMLGADQVSRKPGVRGFYLAQDKRRSLFDFSHLRKRAHSIRLTHSWSSILNLHGLIHSQHQLLCLTHECNELLNLNARGNKTHFTPSFLCFWGGPLRLCQALGGRVGEVMEP